MYGDMNSRKTPLVSIIVPVYNISMWLPRCMDSICQQTFSDYECILVDDGSCDDSGSLCDYYSCWDSRFIAIHTVNGGVSNARNIGIELASGQFIVFCDSDDRLHPDYLKELIDNQLSHHDDFVICGYNKVFRGTEKQVFVFSDQSKESRLPLRDYMLLFDKELIQTPYCKVFKAHIIIDENIRFDTQLSLGEDIVFVLSYLTASSPESISVINEALYDYYQNGGNALSVKYRSDLLDVYQKVYSAIYSHLLIWDSEMRNMVLYYHQRFHHYIIAFHSIMSDENHQAKHEKYKRVNMVIKTNDFQKVLTYRKQKMNRLIYYAYKCAMYQIVCLLEWLASIIRRL